MKKILLLIIVIISFAMPSCMDLDEEIYSEIASNSFYSNENEVISGYLRAYKEVAHFYAYRTLRFNMLGTDMACWPQKGRHGWDNGWHYDLHKHNFYPEEVVLTSTWNGLYGMVGYCNDVITNIEAVDFEAKGINLNKTQLISELRGLRAYVYFWLMDMWGNVPIVTKVGEPKNPATEPRAEVYQFIIDEITAVYSNLPVKGTGEYYAKFTQGAADALLAKLYINAEVYTGTAQYAKCIEHCDNIIDGGKYSLDPNWQGPFMVNNENSNENIFVYANHSEYGSGLRQQMNLHYAHQTAYDLQVFCWNGIVTEKGFYNLFAAEDHRIEQWLHGLQVVNGVTLLGTEEFAGQPLVLNSDMTGLTMTTCNEAVGARNIKYELDLATDNLWNNDVPILRYADILLMKAECLLRGGNSTDALTLVNEVRERAYEDNYAAYGTLTSLSLDNILDERGREFAYEIWRRNDLIRFDKYVTMAWWDHTPSNDHNKEIFPIPADAIRTNPNLVQNVGY